MSGGAADERRDEKVNSKFQSFARADPCLLD